MNVYIVIKDDVPSCATLSEQEAHAVFDSSVRSGRYRQASVHVVSTVEEDRKVLLEAYQAA